MDDDARGVDHLSQRQSHVHLHTAFDTYNKLLEVREFSCFVLFQILAYLGYLETDGGNQARAGVLPRPGLFLEMDHDFGDGGDLAKGRRLGHQKSGLSFLWYIWLVTAPRSNACCVMLKTKPKQDFLEDPQIEAIIQDIIHPY